MKNRPLHIGLYCRGWPVDEYPNGIVTYVHNLRVELINQGHRVSVFVNVIGNSNHDHGVYCVKPLYKGRIKKLFDRLSSTDPHNLFDWGKAIGAAVNKVNALDPLDVFEMEESFGWCADVQKLVTVPVVARLHGPEFLTRTASLGHAEIAAARIDREGNGLRQIAAIVSPSKSTLVDTVSCYSLVPKITKVIRNPVAIGTDVGLWNCDTCDRKTILFVGQFSKVKGGDLALLAFRKLVQSDEQCKLVFVGPDRGLASPNGTVVTFLEFTNGLFTDIQKNKITYLGQLPRAKIFELRRRAMITIVASRWENQPNTILEAMMQGCPIVAFDTGGIAEIVEDETTGLLARRNDIDDFCQKIMRLLAEPEMARRLGENAHSSVMERHSVRKLTAETVEVYRETIRQSQNGQA
jgi:glycosyltransferase involved in cell wall biosynthesis